MIVADEVPDGAILVLKSGAAVLCRQCGGVPCFIGPSRIIGGNRFSTAWPTSIHGYFQIHHKNKGDSSDSIYGWFQHSGELEEVERFASSIEVSMFMEAYPTITDVLSPDENDPATWWALIGGNE
jgi:hypothetical protein